MSKPEPLSAETQAPADSPLPHTRCASLGTHLRTLAARCARVLSGFTLENERAQGMPGARCTRGLVRNGEWMRARAYRLSGGTRHPLRNGFTAYAVLSSATNSSCHRRRRIQAASQSRSGSSCHRRLGTSNGCQNHTVLPYAKTSFVLHACNSLTRLTRPATAIACRRSRVHHIPSRVRDDARPPLFSERDGRR
jgi:hypothetical protein